MLYVLQIISNFFLSKLIIYFQILFLRIWWWEKCKVQKIFQYIFMVLSIVLYIYSTSRKIIFYIWSGSFIVSILYLTFYSILNLFPSIMRKWCSDSFCLQKVVQYSQYWWTDSYLESCNLEGSWPTDKLESNSAFQIMYLLGLL